MEETSAYCTVNHRASASNYQLSNMKCPAFPERSTNKKSEVIIDPNKAGYKMYNQDQWQGPVTNIQSIYWVHMIRATSYYTSVFLFCFFLLKFETDRHKC